MQRPDFKKLNFLPSHSAQRGIKLEMRIKLPIYDLDL